MQSFMFIILHIPGRVNRVADFFSRSGAPLAFLGLLLGGFSPIFGQNGKLFYKNAQIKNASSLFSTSPIFSESPICVLRDALKTGYALPLVFEHSSVD